MAPAEPVGEFIQTWPPVFSIPGEIVIELKALRERREDVPALFAYYMDEFGDGLRVEDGLMELLCQYHWPGNVRELVNVTRTLYVLGRKRKVIRITDIPARIRSMMTGEVGMDAGRGSEDSVLQMLRSGGGSGSEEVRRLIESSLDKHDGNKSAVARELGISRNTLYRRLRELKID